MKRIICAALAALTLALSGCSASNTAKTSEPYVVDYTPEYEEGCVAPPFWVIEDDETGARVFLLGSIHAGVSGAEYPQYILSALESSDWAAAEMDTVAFSGDYSLQKKCIEYMTLENTTAAEIIGDGYDEILDFFQSKGIYQAAMESLIPYYWASAANKLVLEEAWLDSSLGTENVLLSYAKARGIEIREIEGAEAQYKMLSEIPTSIQLETLQGCIGDDKITEQAEQTTELYQAWRSFDEEYFASLEVYNADEVDNLSDWEEYYDLMYSSRQEAMAEFVISALENGEQGFVFVGTLHYYAEPSIISLVEEAGYTVKKICPEKPEASAA